MHGTSELCTINPGVHVTSITILPAGLPLNAMSKKTRVAAILKYKKKALRRAPEDKRRIFAA